MTGWFLAAALLAALTASGLRWVRRLRRRRALAALDGGSRASAIRVDGFSDIEEHVARRQCPCGGRLVSHGERSESDGKVMLRVARVECDRCEERGEVWFDVSRAYH